MTPEEWKKRFADNNKKVKWMVSTTED